MMVEPPASSFPSAAASKPKYIIVGAGPAGCALAAALVKGQKGMVVMLERGKEEVRRKEGRNMEMEMEREREGRAKRLVSRGVMEVA